MDHAFTGPSYTLGVEEELMILDTDEHDLVNAIETLLEAAPDGEIKPELMESVLEIATKPCANTAEAGQQLRRLRTMARVKAADKGLLIGSAGTHPFALWEDQRIVARPRYRDLISALRFVARQELIFGLHVHVGVDDPEKAIHVANGMRVHVPILLALSANSPFWRGDRTGLMSVRTPIFRSFPRVGIPPAYRNWAHYEEEIGFMVRSGVMEDYTYLWYDVRPHPRFGTVEVRACDAQTRVEHTLALAALIQAMVKELCEHFDAGETLTDYPWQMLDENKWLASRHGLDGELVDLPSDTRVGSRDLARRLVERLRPHAQDLGSAGDLDGIEDLLTKGNGARSSSTTPTTTCARSWRRSSAPPRHEARPRRPGPMIGRTMAGAPDLFVVCKNCGSEVSPYITECPYCGQRLRKRAPKIERDETGTSRPKVRRPAKPTLGRLRTNEIPGIRGDELQRPYVTIALVVLGAIGYLVLSFLDRGDLAIVGPLETDWWRVLTAPFVYGDVWYQLPALLAVGLFGFLLERRHGSLLVLALWLLCASGGAAVAALAAEFPVVLGGNGGALGLLAAWAVPVVLARRREPDDDEADLLGVLVIGVLLAALPLATDEADPVAGTVGGVIGLLAGLVLSRVRPRA